MSSRLLLKLVLFGFIAAGLATTLHKAALSKAAALRQAAASAKAVPAGRTAVVYYFYTNTRCASCTKLEELARTAVQLNFASPYKGWQVEFRGVNTDEPANARYLSDYQLSSKSVVVQAYAGGKPLGWARLDQAWTLLNDQEALTAYVAAETRKLLDQQ